MEIDNYSREIILGDTRIRWRNNLYFDYTNKDLSVK